jgi:hypothetical protein
VKRVEYLLGLLAPVLGQLAIADSRSRASGAIADLALLGLAVLGMMAAAGCLVAALWLAALPRFGPAEAPVMCAIILIVISAVLIVIGTGALRRKKATPEPAPALIELLQKVDTERLVRDHKADLLIGALVVGLLTGVVAPKLQPANRPRE